MDIMATMSKGYFSGFPVGRGKWKTWQLLNPYFRSRGFEKGIYTIADQFKMELDPEEYIHVFIYYWGEWEPDETWLLRKILRPGDIFLDVGANVGYFSLLAASIVGEQGRVIAVEAVPPTAELLQRNIDLNGFRNVEVHNCAASDTPGQLNIGRPSHGSGQSSLRLRGDSVTQWEVQAQRLDDLIGQELPLRFVKMDIEGAECLALKGAANMLSRADAPMVICEVTDSYLRELGSSALELLKLMEGYGFTKMYDVHNRSLKPINSQDIKHGFQTNVLFTKHGIADLAR